MPILAPPRRAGYGQAGTWSADDVWTVVVKCPAAALGIEAGEATMTEVQFERHRAPRENLSARDYYWTAPMRPSWLQHFRFGQLQVGAAGADERQQGDSP